ncbi:MAG TPA: right-handed parallel beta-helix repeat-containing protein [Solirubrobacteraceae bacterium]|jgi:nitrous oxidase accessory protein NosD|nr:right-handed parallel beta-helix repeat-containing protein [Solirubrobacteraceae bacterium]
MRAKSFVGALAVALALGAGAASAQAAPTVCSSGCAYTGIQAAINGAASGSTITVGPGNYYENVVVDKSVTLRGSGALTIVYPAVSKPVCEGGSLCGGEASNIVLVQADNVTISRMWLRGDNPSLTSGVVVGGEDIDARNGIITDHETGVYNNLTVTGVKVTGVYLRGIYASSGGSFNFNHDTVENVQGSESSIAMFAFEGTGVMERNHVSEANDALSANWSKGIQFLYNVVKKSGSGLHTDNNGGSGGSADLIKGNIVRECKPNGYGVFVFVPYVSPTVEGNHITGCAVGLAAFGSAVSGQGATFSGNSASGVGAVTTGGEPTYGAYLTTDQLGYAFGDLSATLTGNVLHGFGTGLLVTQTSPTAGQPAGGQATVHAAGNNSLFGDGTGANGLPGTVVEAQNDWWGCPTGPNTKRCTTAVGTVQFTPWLTAKP